MATKTKKSETQVTDYLNDLVDVTRDLADDVIDVVGKVEKSARDRSKDALDKLLPTDKDLKELRRRTQDLTDQVEKLVTLRGLRDKSTAED